MIVRLQTEMNAEVALALTSCLDPDECPPDHQHWLATAEEVDAARRWIAEHPWQVEAWRAQRLGEIDGMLRHWEADYVGPGPGGAWVVRPLLDAESILVSGLTKEQAEAIVEQHNVEIGRALQRLSWYAGTTDNPD
jgi:hypothetical protein